MPFLRTKNPFPLVCLVLALVTAALYLPITTHPFIIYDDGQFVTDNHHVTTGLSWTNFKWALTSGEASSWHPVTWLSHQLDCTLFGLHAGAHHLVNLLFHVANTLLVLVFLRRATGALWRSAFVAAFFAWHPLHVESVAWAAERKDMLSTFFWFLTLLAYLNYARTRLALENAGGQTASPPATLSPPRPWVHYLLALLWFALALMSKPMVVTLPFVLLLLDFWPLGRLLPALPATATPAVGRSRWPWLVVEKFPFFVLAAASSAITYLVQLQPGAAWQSPLRERFATAVIGYARYVIKLFWPEDLSLVYTSPDHWPVSLTALALLLLVLWTIPVLLQWRRCPYLLVGWCWFLGTLVPAIGLVQFSSESMADRYTYIPSIGFFIMVVWAVADFVAAHPVWRRPLCLAAGGALAGCLLATSVQIGYWRDGETLFLHSIAVTTDNYVADNLLGKALENRGQNGPALLMYRQAVEAQPRFPQSQYNYGLSLLSFGQYDEAFDHLKAAAAMEAHDPDIQQALGNIFAQHGSPTNALNCFSNVVLLRPDSAMGHFSLACILANLGRFPAAADEFRATLRLQPDLPGAQAQYNRLLTDHPELRR